MAGCRYSNQVRRRPSLSRDSVPENWKYFCLTSYVHTPETHVCVQKRSKSGLSIIKMEEKSGVRTWGCQSEAYIKPAYTALLQEKNAADYTVNHYRSTLSNPRATNVFIPTLYSPIRHIRLYNTERTKTPMRLHLKLDHTWTVNTSSNCLLIC